ncbi:hypothetical protein Syun_025486 [Stephania yunnanensis]|uniref:1-deoxy-D-xylulose-5-phosphate reductoisomerase n=1 Tax=Stephania yunnanensis TaxID=152371 RepID=A0AAP0ESA4_9MAGN
MSSSSLVGIASSCHNVPHTAVVGDLPLCWPSLVGAAAPRQHRFLRVSLAICPSRVRVWWSATAGAALRPTAITGAVSSSSMAGFGLSSLVAVKPFSPPLVGFFFVVSFKNEMGVSMRVARRARQRAIVITFIPTNFSRGELCHPTPWDPRGAGNLRGGKARNPCGSNFLSIILTIYCFGASDRNLPVEKLKEVKVADALKHPNWNMGKTITVDSATLFNKVFGPSDAVDFVQQHPKDFSGFDVSEIANLGYGAKLQKRRQELTQTTPDQPVDDEEVYYKVAGDCPKGCVYSLRSLWRKKRRYVDHDASTSQMLAQ